VAIVYLTIDDLVAINAKTVEISGGGAAGALDLGPLTAVLDHIQNDDYYPSIEEKLTHLFFCIVKFHCFRDGNKRTAIAACVHMLSLNGYLYCLSQFLRDMENISVQVADDSVNKELLGELIAARIALDTENEALKLKYLEAISVQVGEGENEPLPEE
jgi:death on curing protein